MKKYKMFNFFCKKENKKENKKDDYLKQIMKWEFENVYKKGIRYNYYNNLMNI